MMTCSHLVFRVDEGVIDALGAVAEVEDGVDLLSTVERLGGSNLTHALRRDIFKDLFVPKYLASEEIFSKIWLCRKLEKIFLQSVCAKKLKKDIFTICLCQKIRRDIFTICLCQKIRKDIFTICLCQNISTLIVYLEFQL